MLDDRQLCLDVFDPQQDESIAYGFLGHAGELLYTAYENLDIAEKHRSMGNGKVAISFEKVAINQLTEAHQMSHKAITISNETGVLK